MPLYNLNKSKLNFISEEKFKLEKDIQKLCENNLLDLLGLEYVTSEITVENYRYDTLAFSQETRSFVVIEYKRDKNYSVVDQGMSYLSIMLNNKSDFILEYNETKGGNLKRDDVDWSQSKVIFVSTSFTQNQIQSINFKDLRIELWEIKKYSDNLLSFNQINSNKSVESFKTITKSEKKFKKLNKELKTYTEVDHLAIANEDIKELYENLKHNILGINDDVKLKVLRFYIAYVCKTNFCDIEIQKKALKIFLNIKRGKLKDPKKLAKDVSKIGHRGNGDFQIQISSDNNIEYIVGLIKQSYKNNSGQTPHTKMWSKRKKQN